jgi:hypothetical protein
VKLLFVVVGSFCVTLGIYELLIRRSAAACIRCEADADSQSGALNKGHACPPLGRRRTDDVRSAA